MNKGKLIPNNTSAEQDEIREEIATLQKELEQVQQETAAFEAVLRSRLANEIIEEQELTVLYKKLKLAKKEKRQEQAKRGKNYKEPKGIKVFSGIKASIATSETQHEMKRLYREAMVYAHPDKFSLAAEKIGLATEITTKLIEIYQKGDVEKLRDFHHHILSGNAIAGIKVPDAEEKDPAKKDLYLEKELQKLKVLLAEAKERHTYQVIKTYIDPLTFIDELKDYYEDRLKKLKKRTRKK